MSERAATTLMLRAFRQCGVRSFFHLPVALFGERTTLPAPWSVRRFWPTSRRLRDAEPVILDAAPLIDGRIVDTSRSFTVGVNERHARLLAYNRDYRAHTLAWVRDGVSFQDIAMRVDRDVRAHGWVNCHARHPEAVFGHRVVALRGQLRDVGVGGFNVPSLAWFAARTVASRGGRGDSPNWNAFSTSDHPPVDGLWAVEPHIADGDVGVKWEEILVIDRGRAYWLDDGRESS
jgi:hypothetical protein